MKIARIVGAAAALCALGTTWITVAPSSLAGSFPGGLEGAPTVSGRVHAPERVELPPMATVHVALLDVAAKDPRAATIAEQTIWPAGAPLPVTFRIAYDPSRIDPGHSYVVRARIVEGDKVLFVSATPKYVLTRGAPDVVDIVVTSVRVR